MTDTSDIQARIAVMYAQREAAKRAGTAEGDLDARKLTVGIIRLEAERDGVVIDRLKWYRTE